MVAVTTEQPSWQHLMVALSNKAATNQQRLVIYQKLGSEIPSDGSLDSIRDKVSSIVPVICGDIQCQDEELVLCALHAMGMFLQHLASPLPLDESSVILRALCNTVMETTNKNVCTRALWCLAKQNLPVSAVKAELPHILSTIEHGQCKKNLQSMTVEHEALNAIIRLLEVVHDPMAAHTGVWAKLVYPLLVHGAHKVRERAMVATEMGLSAMMQHQTQFCKSLEEDLKTLLIGELQKLIAMGEEVYALKVWGLYVKLLGKTLHRSSLINPLLRIPQQGFRHPNPAVKCAAFGTWKTLIDNFALIPDIIGDLHRVKLIMQVFARLHAKEESVASAKFAIWWHFLHKLGPKVSTYFEQVCVPLLQFCSGGIISSLGSTPAKPGARTPTHNKLADMAAGFGSPGTPQMNLTANPGSTVSTFPAIQRKGFEVIAHFLGTQGDNVDNPIPRFSLDPLEHAVVTGVPFFVKHAPVLIGAVREIIIGQGDQIPESLLYHVWYSLVARVKNVLDTAGKRDGVDVFVCFLINLRQIVHSKALAVDKVLKLLEAVLCLSPRALVSAAYSTGGTTEVMQNCPALFLMDLLLHESLVDSSSAHQRFFTLLEKLISCGFGHGCSALDFSQMALQLIDRAAACTQNKDALWDMWSMIARPINEHIAKTNEVNQGDLLEHNFSCLHAVLLFPIQHLMPHRMLQSTLKTLLKTWTELCSTFARLAAMVTNAEANIWAEELCAKMCDVLPTVDNQGAQCLDGLLQICLAVVGHIDFTAPPPHGLLHSKPHHLGPSPTSFGRWKHKPLGNLHSVVRLVARLLAMLADLIANPPAETETKKTPCSTYQPPALTAVRILTSLYSSVTVSTLISEMTTSLAPGMAGLYAIAARRANQKVFTAQVLDKLDALWTTFTSTMKTKYSGIHDSEFLEQMAPLFEVGLVHPRKLVKNQTVSLWNATFGQGAPLKYPDSLKPVIAKARSGATLLLPGWDSTGVTEDDETTFSDMMTQGESQCVVPNIIGFPSPLKGCGSFMQKTASPNVAKSPLAAASSPCRDKMAAARRKLPLAVYDLKNEEFVVIQASPKRKRVLTEHQKEVKREKRVIPVMYSNLDASQDTQLESFDSDTQMSHFDGESRAPVLMRIPEATSPSQQVSKNTDEKPISDGETTEGQPKERRKQIRWALDEDNHVPGDVQPKDELRDLPAGTAEIEKKPTELEHKPERTKSSVSKSCVKTLQEYDEATTSEVIQTEKQTQSTNDDRERKPHSEKSKVRSLVRRTRSFSKAPSGGSPVKLQSPSKLSPTKMANQRPCSKSSPKTASHLQKLDHWLVKSCDNSSGKAAVRNQDASSSILSESVDCIEDSSHAAMDEGASDVGIGKTDRAIISSFDGNADSNSNETEGTVPASLTSPRLPIVELVKLSEDEILRFSPKKPDNKQATYEASNTRESKIVHKLRISDESDSDVSGTSDDLFEASHNAVGFDANYVSRNFSEISTASCEESKSLADDADKTVTDDGRGFDIGKFTKQEQSDSGRIVIDDRFNTSEGSCGATAADRHSSSSGSELGSRSRQRRPPGWLRDMEFVPLSPRSQDKSNSPAARRQSPHTKKTASAKTIDFSKAGRPGRPRKTSLSFDLPSTASAVNDEMDPAYGKEDGNDENVTDKITSDGEKEQGGADEIATEGARLTRIPLKSFKPQKQKSSVSEQAATEVTDEKSLADVNEDTPQSASSSAGCDKRSSSKQAKKAGTPLVKRGMIKAKVLEPIFSRRLDATESSDEEDIPLSMLSASNDTEADSGITDDLPLSQFTQTFRNEKSQSNASDVDFESQLTQDSVLMSADAIGEDTDETQSSTVARVSHLTTVEVSHDVVPPTEGSTGKTQPPQRRHYRKRSAFELLQKQLGIAMVTSPEHKSLRSKGTDILKSRTLSSLEKLRRKRRLALKRKKGSGKNRHTEEAKLVSGVCRKDIEVVSSCVTPDDSTVCESNETLEKFDQEEDSSCMIVNDSDTREIGEDGNKMTDTPTKRAQSLDSEEISEDIVSDKVESPAPSRASQSATERLKNQLGIKMKTSPVHKCLRSNKGAKLFKTRSHSSLEKIHRKRQHGLTRKRKRESGGDGPRSNEAECVVIISQDSEAVSSMVTQDGCTVTETMVSSETDQEVESIVGEDKITVTAVFDKQESDTDHDETAGASTKRPQSVDTKEDRKASFAMSRASLILHRARLMMRNSNKPSPNSTESVAADRDSAKPQLPRCVGILKPPRDSDATERGGQSSPPSQFRPVQLPCVYSPSASPSAGILKKQRLSIAAPSETPSPKSPSKKRRRVSFADSVQTVEFRRHATRARPVRLMQSPHGASRCLEIPRRNRSSHTTIRRKHSGDDVPTTDTVSPGAEGPGLDSTDPIFPQLVDCDARVEHVLPQLTSSLWVRGLEQLVRSKKLRTIGDLSSLTETQVNNLPIRSPKVLTMRRALQSFSESSKLTHASKSTGVLFAEKEPEKEDGLRDCGRESAASNTAGSDTTNSPQKDCASTSTEREETPLPESMTVASSDKQDSDEENMIASPSRPDRLTSTQDVPVASPATSDLRCVEDELAKLSPIKRGDLDSSLETSLLLLETSGGETEHSNQQEPRPIDDTEGQSFSSNATVLDSTNDAEVIAMDISGLKERLASTDLTQLGSHDLVEVHEHLNSMMASVVLALKAKCRTSPKRASDASVVLVRLF